MSSTCSYVHRQGSQAGKTCTHQITHLDPMASYCSTHYKMKSIQKDRIAELAEEVALLRTEIRELREMVQSKSS